jgi:hypothetical protein
MRNIRTMAFAVEDQLYKRVIELARDRGYIHRNSGTPNNSEILRELVKTGLEVAEREAVQNGDNGA